MNSFRFQGPGPTRLDVALGHAVPLGRRGRQKLVEQGLVLVDGKPARKGTLVHPGQWVCITAGHAPTPHPADRSALLVVQTDSFAAIVKPAGMPSVRGMLPASLEETLPLLGLSGWQLLNRLDTPTSGLVLAAKDAAAAAQYHAWQEKGQVHKWYLAVVHGHLFHEQVCTARIEDAHRRQVRVLPVPDPSPLRHTHIFPLVQDTGTTLVLVRIHKGRRHHIRAHLAACGHPIVGDDRYAKDSPEGGLFLHHAALVLPEFTASTPPAWPRWQKLWRAVPAAALPADFVSMWPDPQPADPGP